MVDMNAIAEALGTTAIAALSFGLGFIMALLVAAIAHRAPGRVFTPILALLGLPFRPLIFVLRRLRILPKVAGRVRSVRNAAASASVAIHSRFANKTEVEKALLVLDGLQAQTVVGDEEASDAPEVHNFEDEEKHLRRDGVIFKSIQVLGGYFPSRLTQPMDDALADEYVKEARLFFNRQIPLRSNERALYEDVEGAVIVEYFRNADRRCFYILNEMRKAINGNGRRLIFLNTVILTVLVALLLSVFHPGADDVLRDLGVGMPPFMGVVAGGVAVLLMLVWHNAGYQKQQQHNARELRSFLTRYLGRISDRYREATGIAKGVTVGDETDSKRLSEAARKWHKVVIWMPFRTFFIESFVRSVLYQINRNSTYYLYIPPAVLTVLTALVIGVFAWSPMAYKQPFFTLEGLPIFVVIAVAVGVYVERIYKVVIAEELSQDDWLGYDNLKASDAMDDVVGKYAEDVGFWKGRLDR